MRIEGASATSNLRLGESGGGRRSAIKVGGGGDGD